eukprot:7402989-Alexandrium_andersonii.AAC.1
MLSVCTPQRCLLRSSSNAGTGKRCSRRTQTSSRSATAAKFSRRVSSGMHGSCHLGMFSRSWMRR